MTSATIADRAFSRFVVSTACVVYLAGYAGYCFGETLGALRFVVYAVPPVLVTSFMLTSRSNRPAAAFFLTYLLLGCMSYLIGVRDINALKEFTILVLIILCFVPMIDVGLDQIRIVFLCSLAYFVLDYLLTDHGGVRLLQVLESGTGSGMESGFDNHQGGLVGPVYAVFLYAVGAKIQFVMAMVMSVLGGKRVGILAILVGLIAAYVFKNAAPLRDRRNRFMVLLAVLAIINIVGSNLITIAEYWYANAKTGVSIEEIMLGRYAIGSEMNHVMNGRSLVDSLVGFGPGSAADLAIVVSDGTLGQPHDDWSRILYDYGIVGSIVITTFMALVFSSSATGAVIAITNGIIMTTDNVFVYLYYQFPIALMLAYAALRDSRVQGKDHCSGR
jgi:hypothetical protein